MDIKKILVLILSVLTFHSCHYVDYWYYDFILENKTGYDITDEWDINRDCEESFVLQKGLIQQAGCVPRLPAKIDSATITFEDGKVLQYSSQDVGRSLCNQDSYELDDSRSGEGLETYKYVLTEEDYALAVMPSEE